jgi:hypothetical protein
MYEEEESIVTYVWSGSYNKPNKSSRNIQREINRLITRLKKFRRKISLWLFPKEIKVQLLWSTWDETCDLIGKFKNGTQGKYVDGLGNISDPSTNLIGLYFNNNGENWLIQQSDWIIKSKSGKISYMTNKQMNRSVILEKINI